MGQSASVALRIEGDAAALVPKSALQPVYELTLPAKVEAPVRAGERLGTLRVTLGEELLAELPVTAAEDVPRLGFGGILRLLACGLIGGGAG